MSKSDQRSRSKLRERLQKGQDWLAETREKLDSMPDAGVGSELETQYVYAMESWADMDALYRFTYTPKGCSLGFACRSDAIVLCEGCSHVTT